MKIELKYFSGTGNSWKVLDTCKNLFIENHNEVTISPININEQNVSNADIIGFCFPVYAFGIPRLCRKYLKKIHRFSNPQKAFVIITAGKYGEAGFSVSQCVNILSKKNCLIIYSAVIEMPVNWTTYMNPPSEQEASQTIENGIIQAREIGGDILKGIYKCHNFNIPKDYGFWGLYREYFLFKLGIHLLWRTFRVYDSCNGCGQCKRICPTRSIEIKENKPVWSSSCEQCMRCVNFCPKRSIYQSMGGGTNGRNRYYMPDFLRTCQFTSELLNQ